MTRCDGPASSRSTNRRQARTNVRARGCSPAPRRRHRVGAFAAALAVAASALAVSAPAGMAQTQTCQPQVGAQGVAPFTVFYCAGDATGQREAVTVAQLLDQVWPEMTRPEPDGLGPPVVPDTNGGRFSVYVTAPTAEVVHGECPDLCSSIGDNFGQAVPAPPFIVRPSGAQRSSAALIINEEKGVNDATVIHEFFHALEFAHSLDGAVSWLSETMATWSEHHYRATDTGRLDFFRAFQNSPGSPLFQRGGTLEYGAYVWLVWLAQSTNSASSVFRLWTALDRAREATDQEIDSLVDRYLTRIGRGFKSSFKDFAVEDLNLNLGRRVTPQLFSRGPLGDPAVPLGVTPPLVRRPWTLGNRARTTRVRLAELSMQYEQVRAISRSVGAVTVSARGIRPWGDVVVLARAGTGWQRVDLQNGSVTFCRRTRRGNVRQLFVIADNHDRQGAHFGSYTISGRTTCPSRRPVTRGPA
jgi:hypothetical protein